MAKINLLPWREELRKQRQQDFVMSMGGAVVVTCILFGMVYMYIEGMKEYQTARNEKLNEEIRAVDKKIAEIKVIEDKKSKLREKISLIEELQASRPKIVHLFDELRKITPTGIYLTSLVQTGSELTLEGKAQSNSRVSDYMRAFEQSKWLEQPKLKVIKGQGKKQDEETFDDFTLMARQTQDKTDAEKGDK